MMKKRILLLWPNTSNRGRITLSIPILTAISKNLGWKTKYFDTSFYEKTDDSFIDKEKTGAFKPTKGELSLEIKPKCYLIPDLQKTIDNFQPDLLAITGMTNDFQYMMTFFPQVKIPKDTKVVFGGIHALHRSEEILKAGIDLACFGQGEYILPQILKRIEQNKDITGISGTSHVDKTTGEIVKNKIT